MLIGCTHSPGSWLPLPVCHSKLPACLSVMTVVYVAGSLLFNDAALVQSKTSETKKGLRVLLQKNIRELS